MSAISYLPIKESGPYPITSRARWRRQPHTAVSIDWSNPLSRDLVFDAAPGIEWRDKEFALNAPRAALGANVSLRPTPWGVGYYFNGSQANYECSWGDWPGLAGCPGLTYEVLYAGNINFDAFAGGGFHGGLWLRDWSGTWRFVLQTPTSDSWAGVWGNFYSTTQLPPGSPIHVVATWRGGTLLANSALFVNGVADTLTAWLDGTPIFPSPPFGSDSKFQLGHDTYGVATAGSLIIARAWRRGMSDAEMRALYENWWGLYR